MSRSRSVLLTGASSGIGLAAAKRLDARDYRVYAGYRRARDAEALRAASTGGLIPVELDVTDPGDIARVADRLERDLQGAGLDGLVNCAGLMLPAPLEFVPLDAVRREFDVNVHGPLALVQKLLPLLRRAQGRIVNVGSNSGSVSTPFTGGYNASKFALRGLNDALRVEVAPWGIEVVLLEPGNVRTPMLDRTEQAIADMMTELPAEAHRLYGPVFDVMKRFIELSRHRGASADAVAEVIERALASPRPRAYYPVGLDARARLLLERLPRRLRDRLIASQLPRYPEGH